MQIARSGTHATMALLKMHGLNLLLPQGEIRALESAANIDVAAPAPHGIGWLAYTHKRWPVYSLSDELTLMADVPSERSACAILATGAGYIGILCDDMIILKDFVGQRYELPAVMKLDGTPILHLAAYEQGIACVTDAHQLTRYIGQLLLNA